MARSGTLLAAAPPKRSRRARDLSQLDFSQFQAARFEFEKKDEQINLRVPRPLLAALKARAKARGIPYTRFIRETLERALAAPQP